MARRRPTGFVARCQCGVLVGAMDFERTGRVEAGQILGRWLYDGCTVEPRFDWKWEAHIESCKCARRTESEGK